MGEYLNSGKQVAFRELDGKAPFVHIADAADNEKAHFLATAANAFDDFDYMAEADKTCSIVYNPQYVNRDNFVKTLSLIVELCGVLNLSKKLLFRGRTPADVGLVEPRLHESLAVEFDQNNPMPGEVDILHGLVGAITEAGEMAEVLLNRIEGGTFDRVNVLEEAGDEMWYIVRMLRGLGTDLPTLFRSNIDKLHGRHGEAFDVFRDANRDLAAERARLETAPIEPGPLVAAMEAPASPIGARKAPGQEPPGVAEAIAKG